MYVPKLLRDDTKTDSLLGHSFLTDVALGHGKDLEMVVLSHAVFKLAKRDASLFLNNMRLSRSTVRLHCNYREKYGMFMWGWIERQGSMLGSSGSIPTEHRYE